MTPDAFWLSRLNTSQRGAAYAVCSHSGSPLQLLRLRNIHATATLFDARWRIWRATAQARYAVGDIAGINIFMAA